jgi:GT2 family glycosyltransferase
VVICAYTERRWPELLAAIESTRTQRPAPGEILVVIDHNPALADRLRAEESGKTVTVLENSRRRGLSGARNTALPVACGEIVAFLDDDAAAEPGWLAALVRPYEDERVAAVGGAATPEWPGAGDRAAARRAGRPMTLPADGRGPWPVRGELDWVVGCTYLGQPSQLAEVRNLMGCNMSFRRAVFDQVGGFTEGVGRVGSVPLGCEETELCIRLRQHDPAARILFEPAALVRHRVSADRLTWRYLRRRSYAEGVSKAAVSTMVGAADALATERAYTAKIIPAALVRELGNAVRGRAGGLVALVLSVLCAGIGYVRGSLRRRGAADTAVAGTLGDGKAAVAPVGGAAGAAAPVAATGPATADGSVAVDRPVAVGEVDLAAEPLEVRLAAVDAAREAESARVLVRRGAVVLGEVDVPVRAGVVPDAELSAALADFSATPESSAVKANDVSVSVVIPSAGRPGAAIRCARSVLATEYPKLEVLLVDNRPDTSDSLALRGFAESDERVRYVPEPVAGASNARNRGAAEATGEILAFTDDDAVVDAHWLAALVDEFADPEVDCVTGLVLPLALDTSAQRLFEDWGGFGKGYQRRRLTAAGVTGETGPDWAGRLALYPFAAGMFGSGNSMAWRAGSFRALGGCDPLLGPGTPTGSGEDLELFVRLIRGGGVLVYTAQAVVRHEHRRDLDALARQMHSYGTGLFPMFAVYVARRPRELFAVARRLPGGLRHMLAGGSERNTGRGEDFPAELARAERRGMVAGPVRLLRGVWRAPRRRLGLPEPMSVENGR